MVKGVGLGEVLVVRYFMMRSLSIRACLIQCRRRMWENQRLRRNIMC
jgi:hypothetical protein